MTVRAIHPERSLENARLGLLRSALRRLETESTGEAAGRRGRDRDLEEAVVAALASGSELPEFVLRTVQTRAAAQTFADRLHDAMLAEVARTAAEMSAAELLPLLHAFGDLRGTLRDPAPPSVQGDTVMLRAETLELAHDFRSPLTSILFLADTLRRGQSGPVTEQQHRQMGIIYGAALRLVSLANDVIGLTHGGEQLMDRRPSAFSLRELLESTIEVVQPIAEDRNLSLRLLVQASDRRIGHAAILGRIFLNLTTNALKYTEEGMVELTARATGADRVELSVRDSGRGLDAETIANLYRPFRTRSEGARPTLDSYGLGLTICRKLVTAIGSELQYETSPGWGTRFYFEASLPPAPATE